MKFNKWTLGLAAVGVVSLTSVAYADETKVSELNTALSNTTISGYVDVAAQFNPGGGGVGTSPLGTIPNYDFGNKANSINLNVVDIAIDKPLDESPWASGYHIEFWVGPDGGTLGVGNDIRQAYIALRTPVGNGIDWKIGVWDTIIGYEGTTSSVNPNYSRSFGYNMEPTTHTGIQGTYKVCDALTVTAGLADTSFVDGYSALANGDPASPGLYLPTVMGLVTLTAPDSFGWAKGATLSGGVINTSGNTGATSWYAGFTLPTPIAALKFGGAFDYLNARDTAGFGLLGVPNNQWVLGGYGTYQFNDKTSFNVRAEYNDFPGANAAQEEFTATLQYNLWANVLTRVEARWDHADHGIGDPFVSHGGGGTVATGATANRDAFLLAVQAIYTF